MKLKVFESHKFLYIHVQKYPKYLFKLIFQSFYSFLSINKQFLTFDTLRSKTEIFILKFKM